MKFIPTKCVHLAISNERNIPKYSYGIYNQQQVSSAKFLGIIILTVISVGKITSMKSVPKPTLQKHSYVLVPQSHQF